jgi:hypothetical protein
VPERVVKAVAAAVKSGDPTVMRSVAGTLRTEGFAKQAASLEGAASELANAISSTPKAKAGKAQAPVKAGKLNPAPRADSTSARRQAGALAQLLSSMTLAEARGSTAIQAAVKDFQLLEKQRGHYVGNLDGLFGRKTALTLAADHGIVPPHPLYWPKRDPKGAKGVYQAQLARFASADPQRREEWNQPRTSTTIEGNRITMGFFSNLKKLIKKVPVVGSPLASGVRRGRRAGRSR